LAVVEGLRDGTIDVIASDHLPQDPDSKRLPFDQAEVGITSVEALLPIALELYHNQVLPLGGLLKTMTANPANLLGLNAGHITKGAPADIILIDPDMPWRIRESDIISKSKNTLFDGRPVQGRCIRTVHQGQTVYKFET
jgi:dihydroorotase